MGSRTSIIALALLLSSCVRYVYVEVEKPNECYTALAQINEYWLQPTPTLKDRPGNEVGDLLQDFADAAAIGGECRARHNSLIEYVSPLVEKAKTQ